MSLDNTCVSTQIPCQDTLFEQKPSVKQNNPALKSFFKIKEAPKQL